MKIKDSRTDHGTALLMIADLNRQLGDIKETVIDCFGKKPIACDNYLYVHIDNYNKLVDVVNK
jgi:hypothetical protein